MKRHKHTVENTQPCGPCGLEDWRWCPTCRGHVRERDVEGARS